MYLVDIFCCKYYASDTESITHFGKNTREIKLEPPIDIASNSYIIKCGKLNDILIESGGGTRPSETRGSEAVSVFFGMSGQGVSDVEATMPYFAAGMIFMAIERVMTSVFYAMDRNGYAYTLIYGELILMGILATVVLPPFMGVTGVWLSVPRLLHVDVDRIVVSGRYIACRVNGVYLEHLVFHRAVEPAPLYLEGVGAVVVPRGVQPRRQALLHTPLL